MFFPNAMMLATSPKALVFFNNARLVNVNTDLHAFPRGQTRDMNTTRDPVQAEFYTHHLLSILGVTNFLECGDIISTKLAFPRNFSASTLRFSIPLFQESHFSYIPWQDVSSHKFTLAVPDIPVPKDFTLDNSTLQSLDKTYNSLDRDLTLCLAKFNHDVNNLEVTDTTTLNDIFTYIAFAFTVLNFIALLVLCGRLRQLSSAPRDRPQVSVAIPLSSQTHTSTFD